MKLRLEWFFTLGFGADVDNPMLVVMWVVMMWVVVMWVVMMCVVMWGSCSGFVNGIARHCPVIDISAVFSS